LVTDMSELFNNKTTFNDDISNWDVSNVTNMDNMFSNAHAFNQPIGIWDVSDVTTMAGMFLNAYVFNKPIGDWDVSDVTTMAGMFYYSVAFNNGQTTNEGTAPLNWDVSNVTTMSGMFLSAFTFNQPIGHWDVSSVTDMASMFMALGGTSAFNQPIGGWDVSNVTNMSTMFYGATSFTSDLSGWDVMSVMDFTDMFLGATQFKADYPGVVNTPTQEYFPYASDQNKDNHGISSARGAMPYKDLTSDNVNTFALGRMSYARTHTDKPDGKKWIGGNRDASQVIAARRINTIGNGSLNAKKLPFSFMAGNEVNTVRSALGRVRNQGSAVPTKVWGKNRQIPAL
jgi:surface protein